VGLVDIVQDRDPEKCSVPVLATSWGGDVPLIGFLVS
jgi:hypothetical protein